MSGDNKVKDLFLVFVDIETALSEIYMRLATLAEETDFVKVYDRAYYEAIEHKHFFIKLRKSALTQNSDVFSTHFYDDAELIKRQLGSLHQTAKRLDKADSYFDLAELMTEVELRVSKLYTGICNEAWESEQANLSRIIAKKETRLQELVSSKKARSVEKVI